MEQGQVILRLFVPPNEQAAKAVHPGMAAFHDPTACFEARLPLDGLGLFSAWANVGGQAECTQDVAHLIIVVALVQTHPLWMLFAWLRTLDHDAFDARAHQFHIVTISSFNRQDNADAKPLREQASSHTS